MKKFPVYILFLFGFSKAQSVSFVQAPGSPMTYTSTQRGNVASDLNGDGISDLIIGNMSAHNKLQIYLGTGNGQFTNAPGSPITLNGSPNSNSVDDFNNDGKQDIAVANWGNGGYVSILLGTGTGSFTNAAGSPIFLGSWPISLKSMDAADFNVDGNKDLVVCDENNNRAYILLGSGSGGFTGSISSSVAVGATPASLKTGFFNSDAFPDFVVTNATLNSISVFFGTGTGTFSQTANSTYTLASNPQNVTAGNLNNDAFPDLVISSFGGASGGLNILLGSANGVFTAPPGSPFFIGSAPFQSVIADFNLDGILDIASSHGGNNISIRLGTGNGTFTTAIGSPIFAIPGGPTPFQQPIVTGDFNGDNKPDLATGEYAGGPSYDRIFVFLNTATGCAVLPVFSYTAGPNGNVNFTSHSTGTTTGATLSWAYGDGGVGTGITSSHTYSANGIYIATLTVTNYTPPCVLSYTTYVNVSTITGIGHSGSNPENYFSVLPNPTSGIIEIKNVESKSGTEFILYNGLGMEELKMELPPATVNTIDISRLKNGVYYYQLVRKDQQVKSGRIVLEK